MNLDEFDYELPEELIAQVPLPVRTDSRLLHLVAGRDDLHDRKFSNLHNLLHVGDLLILNNTKVLPARFFGQKESGGKVECLLERVVNSHIVMVQLKASNAPKPGSQIIFTDKISATVKERKQDFFVLEFNNASDFEYVLTNLGQMPLPPYIKRHPSQEDIERYQTVYAEHEGAIAAPTAGLHFDNPMLEKLQKEGIDCDYITLHVGAGTFQPVRAEKIVEHVLHAEHVEVNQQVCKKIQACNERGSRVIAVGTTVVRALESAALNDGINPYSGDTNLFIFPGYKFKIVDALITNFHLPKSSLLMLVCAFAGYEQTMAAYQHAVEQEYRFFSYGDAMFIEK